MKQYAAEQLINYMRWNQYKTTTLPPVIWNTAEKGSGLFYSFKHIYSKGYQIGSEIPSIACSWEQNRKE